MIRPGIEAEFDRVWGSGSILHPIHGGDGGEWDTLRRLGRPALRTLTGARLLTPHGMFPDDAATHVIGPRTGLFDTCEAMEWFGRTALLAIEERRRRRHHERHLALAKRHDHRTYFRYRNALSVERGYPSYAAERQARWSDSEPTNVIPFNEYLRTLALARSAGVR